MSEIKYTTVEGHEIVRDGEYEPSLGKCDCDLVNPFNAEWIKEQLACNRKLTHNDWCNTLIKKYTQRGAEDKPAECIICPMIINGSCPSCKRTIKDRKPIEKPKKTEKQTLREYAKGKYPHAYLDCRDAIEMTSEYLEQRDKENETSS